jgi:hypothetical protein
MMSNHHDILNRIESEIDNQFPLTDFLDQLGEARGALWGHLTPPSCWADGTKFGSTCLSMSAAGLTATRRKRGGETKPYITAGEAALAGEDARASYLAKVKATQTNNPAEHIAWQAGENLHIIDIDDAQVVLRQEVQALLLETPWYRSRNKRLPHLLVHITDLQPAFPATKQEGSFDILNRTCAWVRHDEKINNHAAPIKELTLQQVYDIMGKQVKVSQKERRAAPSAGGGKSSSSSSSFAASGATRNTSIPAALARMVKKSVEESAGPPPADATKEVSTGAGAGGEDNGEEELCWYTSKNGSKSEAVKQCGKGRRTWAVENLGQGYRFANASLEQCWRDLVCASAPHRRAVNECISGNEIVVLFADIDNYHFGENIASPEWQQQLRNWYRAHLPGAFAAFLSELVGVEVPAAHVLLVDSSGLVSRGSREAWKASYHVIVKHPGLYFASIDEQRRFWDKPKHWGRVLSLLGKSRTDNDEEETWALDHQVYRAGNFRTAYSCKPKSNAGTHRMGVPVVGAVAHAEPDFGLWRRCLVCCDVPGVRSPSLLQKHCPPAFAPARGVFGGGGADLLPFVQHCLRFLERRGHSFAGGKKVKRATKMKGEVYLTALGKNTTDRACVHEPGRVHGSNNRCYLIKPHQCRLQVMCGSQKCKKACKLVEVPVPGWRAPFNNHHVRVHPKLDWDALCASPPGVFPDQQSAFAHLHERVLARMNNYFAIIKAVKPICVEKRPAGDGEYEYVKRTVRDTRETYQHWTLTFKYEVKNNAGKTSTRTETVSVIERWLEWRRRLEFERTVFNPRPFDEPGHARADEFNVFRGFKITADIAREAYERECGGGAQERLLLLIAPFLTHIRTIWAKGEPAVSDYLLNWFAHLLQRPWDKMGVAPVVGGSYGSGKGCVLSLIGQRIIGKHHYTDVGHIDDVIGRFNASDMACPLLVFMDEGSWGGDRKQGGVLRKLLTETTHRLEQKNMPKETVDSYANFVFASNEDWIVPCDIGERRWLILQTDNRHAGSHTERNKSYFDAFHKVDARLVAHFLYTRDLLGFNPREVPRTKDRQQHVELSMGSVARWWNKCLQQQQCVVGPERAWQDALEKRRVYQEYSRSHEAAHQRVGESQFWRALKKMAVWQERQEHRRPDFGPAARIRVVQFAALDASRAQFRGHVRDPLWEFGEGAI